MLSVALLLSAGGYLFYLLYFGPQVEQLRAFHLEAVEAREEVAAAHTRGWNDIPALQAEINVAEQRLDELQAWVPRIKDTPGLLVSLYELTVKYGLDTPEEVTWATFHAVERQDGYLVLPIELQLVGHRADVYQFVYAVEHFDRLLGIREGRFAVSVPDQVEHELGNGAIRERDFDQVECTLTIEVYILETLEADPEHYWFMDFEGPMILPGDIFRPGTETPAGTPGPVVIFPDPGHERPIYK